MKYLKDWFSDLESKPGITWKKNISITGECNRHIGPSIWFASVTLGLSPSDQFEVENTLDPKVAELIQDRGWYDYIVYGVLDVMLATPTSPIRNFRLIINQVGFNEVESNQTAFRLAARDAAIKALDMSSST